MERREFLTGAVGAAGVGVLAESAGAQERNAGGKQVLELRRYSFATPEKREAFEKFLASGLIPALNRVGVRPAGAFRMTKADNPEATFNGEIGPDLYLLLPHASAASAVTLDAGLAKDAAYTQALAGLGETPKTPAFSRYESSLLLAFDQCSKVEVPTKSPDRVLQLRIYEAMNDERCRMKVRMFNEGGEIRLFREVGLNPVFFGHALSGTKLPNLTYMLGFENEGAQKEAWAKFLKHPEWLKLRNDPMYKDTVSQITNLVLRPTAGSQI